MTTNAWRKKGGDGFKPWKFFSACGMSALLLIGQTAPLLGNPTGGTVVAGSATIGPAGSTLQINQSTQNAIINWQQFSIASGETTKFIVPNSGATLNRVTGGNLSAIYGNLQSNGTLYLVNPNGIVVGPSGRIDTAGFLASTLDVSNQQFLSGGKLEFAGNSNAAVENDGIIHASTGDVYMIADQVSNKGTLSAAQGTVGLAAGQDILLQQSGSTHLFVQPTPAGTTRAKGVTNAGTIRAAAAELKAAGGNAYALAINNTGVIAVTGYKKVNGEVYLTSDGGGISNSGTISAQQSGGNGGTIVVDGTAVSAQVSGTVTNSGTLNASATVAGGKGGKVSVKNMGGKTVHSGKIIAKGGQGGAGGSAEVSGATVKFTGTVDLTAPGGATGNLLLDPTTFTVAASGGDETGAAVSATLQTANLTLNADNTVTINDGITWTSGATLTLSTNTAGSSSIAINAPILGVNGGLTISAAGSDPITTGASGTVDVANFILQSGTWSQIGSLPAFIASHDFELQGSSTFERFAGVDAANGNADEITDVYGLQGLASPSGNLLTSNAELVSNIDASRTAVWNSGAGFVPIGENASGLYTGVFNGQGHTINGLFINRPSTPNVGLFGDISSATIENVGVTNVQVSGDPTSGSFTGALVGFSLLGAINDAYTTGSVGGGDSVGGLLGGQNGGTVSNTYSLASVSGANIVGGLVGYNGGTINTSYSTGALSLSFSAAQGGLVGQNPGTITNSFWDTTTSGTLFGIGLIGGTVTNVFGLTSADLLSASTYAGTNTSSVGTAVTFVSGLEFINDPGANISFSPGWNIGNSLGNTWVIFDGQTRPMLSMEYSTTITNAHQLQLIGLNATTLAANYTVANDIDLTGDKNASEIWGTSTTNGGAGFVPIGDNTTHFTGTFNGQGNAINGLYINAPATDFVGLFGFATSAISNVGVTNVQVRGLNVVGGLAGSSSATISNSSSTGLVGGAATVGGLVGFNSGSITSSYSTTTVRGTVSGLGGLIGQNGGTIDGDYSTTGTVLGGNGTFDVGGLVGDNQLGSISNAHSTDLVLTGDNSSAVGGLVGQNDSGGMIAGSYSTGAVTAGSASSDTGGLVGANSSGSTITNAHSQGAVSVGNGSISVGGLVGLNISTISNAYNTGAIIAIGSSNVGGLVGANQAGTITYGYNTGAVVTGGTSFNVGGLVGTNDASIIDSYNSGAVNVAGFGGSNFGGLVGVNTVAGSINKSYSSGAVTTGTQTFFIGGLVGDNAGSINNAYNLGAVSGFDFVGGLVGENEATGTINDAYSTGAVGGRTSFWAAWWGRSGVPSRTPFGIPLLRKPLSPVAWTQAPRSRMSSA